VLLFLSSNFTTCFGHSLELIFPWTYFVEKWFHLKELVITGDTWYSTLGPMGLPSFYEPFRDIFFLPPFELEEIFWREVDTLFFSTLALGRPFPPMLLSVISSFILLPSCETVSPPPRFPPLRLAVFPEPSFEVLSVQTFGPKVRTLCLESPLVG